MVNVVVGRKRTVQISTNATAGIIDTTTPVVLKNNPVLGGGGVTRLDKLVDVAANNEVNGATLVYNAANDTYVVQKLDLANVTGDLDGGTF
jgi:hypothetical protein